MPPLTLATYTAWVVLNKDDEALRREYVYDGWSDYWVANWAHADTFGSEKDARDEAADHYSSVAVAKVVCRVEEIHRLPRRDD